MNVKIDETTRQIYTTNQQIFNEVERLRKMLVNLKISASRLPTEESRVMFVLADSLESISMNVTKRTDDIRIKIKEIAEENKHEN